MTNTTGNAKISASAKILTLQTPAKPPQNSQNLPGTSTFEVH